MYAKKRVPVVKARVDDDLLRELDARSGPRGRSRVIVTALQLYFAVRNVLDEEGA
jgi:metal-responsive CopG/Arc/MetJ family transcriptional regulator